MTTPRFPDRYRVVRELGQGGMATVYLAEDTKHRRQVAIKVLRPELAAAIGAERFTREIELTANLQHPHILPLFDSGNADGSLFYVMPFVEGESLRDRITRDGKLPVAEALAIATDVGAALASAHARGVVHRDIKPENILLSGGDALVADFGIAITLSGVTNDRVTATGLSIGTPAYMSPEQIASDNVLDGRSDQYSLACVLFEMLSGEPPFTGPSAQSVIAQTLVDEPRRARTLRGDVPPSTDAAIARALAKEPKNRFETVDEFVAAFTPPAPAASPLPRRFALLGAAVVVLLLALAWPLAKSWRTSEARASLPAVVALSDQGRFLEAYEGAVRLERWLAGDSVLTYVMNHVSDVLLVTTNTADARVYLQRIPAVGEEGTDSLLIGTTPMGSVRIPRVDHRLGIHREGYESVERIASSALQRGLTSDPSARVITLDVVLYTVGSASPEMVAVPGGDYVLVGPDLPVGLHAQLRPFLIDRFEVTNEDFREFVRSGGYQTEQYWPGVSESTRALFTDRTGLASPREWQSQEPPRELHSHPVSDVSWYEARAYCTAKAKRLPTLFEWEKAARNGVVSPYGVVMPWGFVSAAVTTPRRANFSGTGTAAVDAFPFGISAFGAHSMAGNVKEWLANRVGDGYAVTGGSWQDPPYVYSEVGSLPPETASPAVGIRCARDAESGAGDQGAHALQLAVPPPVYRPVSADRFQALRAFYEYDRRPANARVTTLDETPDWRKERIWIDGAGGDSILIYLYLPARATPPYQTIIQVPSSAAFFFEPAWMAVEHALAPHIKAGRAVMQVIFSGMIERAIPGGMQPPASNSVEFRDLMVRHATELRMAMDYLETRADMDTSRFAYLGMSWGAGSRAVMAGVDDRFKAFVLIGAGIDERIQPTLPEASNINFVSHLKGPKLMLNGRQDEEHPWLTRAKPMWDLLPEPKELVLIDGVGHHPPLEYRVPPINAFLDRTLGRVILKGAVGE